MFAINKIYMGKAELFLSQVRNIQILQRENVIGMVSKGTEIIDIDRLFPNAAYSHVLACVAQSFNQAGEGINARADAEDSGEQGKSVNETK